MLDEVSLDLIISWQPAGGFVASNSGFLCARSLVIILLFMSAKKVHKTWAAVTTDLETKRGCCWLHWDVTVTAAVRILPKSKIKFIHIFQKQIQLLWVDDTTLRSSCVLSPALRLPGHGLIAQEHGAIGLYCCCFLDANTFPCSNDAQTVSWLCNQSDLWNSLPKSLIRRLSFWRCFW